jgi:hypothetical protein
MKKFTINFVKEKRHFENEKEVLRDEDKWYFKIAGFVIATIVFHKFIKFNMYTVSYNCLGATPSDKKDYKTLADAVKNAVAFIKKKSQET